MPNQSLSWPESSTRRSISSVGFELRSIIDAARFVVLKVIAPKGALITKELKGRRQQSTLNKPNITYFGGPTD